MSISRPDHTVSQFVMYKSSNKSLQSTARPLLQERQNKKCTCIQPFQIQQQQKPQSFACDNCTANLERVTQLKKVNVIIQYENAKLKQEVEKLKSENQHLRQRLTDGISIKINAEMNSTHYLSIKQDLQAQLFECKIINQLLMIGQYPKSEGGLKQKYQQVVLEKLILQEQLEQRNRIINDKVFYSIYHYDSRLKSLKDAVSYFYRMATKECKKTQQMIKKLKKEAQTSKLSIRNQIMASIQSYFQNYYKQNNHTLNTNILQSKLDNEIDETKQQFYDQIVSKQNQSQKSKLKHQNINTKTKRKSEKSKIKPKQQISNKSSVLKPKQDKRLIQCCMNIK